MHPLYAPVILSLSYFPFLLISAQVKMENQWSIPPTDRQGLGHHLIPPTPEHPGPAFQPNVPMYQQNEYPTFQNCYCARCFDMRRAEGETPNWYPVEQQDPRYSGSAGIPFLNRGQDVGNRGEMAMIVPERAEQLAPPQTARIPDNLDYDLTRERAGPPNVNQIRAPILDESIREGRRRLAGRYLNNPDTYVSTIRLEPGASGQPQVVITLEMVNIF